MKPRAVTAATRSDGMARPRTLALLVSRSTSAVSTAGTPSKACVTCATQWEQCMPRTRNWMWLDAPAAPEVATSASNPAAMTAATRAAGSASPTTLAEQPSKSTVAAIVPSTPLRTLSTRPLQCSQCIPCTRRWTVAMPYELRRSRVTQARTPIPHRGGGSCAVHSCDSVIPVKERMKPTRALRGHQPGTS